MKVICDVEFKYVMANDVFIGKINLGLQMDLEVTSDPEYFVAIEFLAKNDKDFVPVVFLGEFSLTDM